VRGISSFCRFFQTFKYQTCSGCPYYNWRRYNLPHNFNKSNNKHDTFGLQTLSNYPNPFNPLTKTKYELKTPGFIKLNVYNITGREIKTIVNEKQNAGVYKADFSETEYGTSISSGVYFYSLFAGEQNRYQEDDCFKVNKYYFS